MPKLIKTLLIVCLSLLSVNRCLADCDFSTIKKSGNKFLYPAECHLKVKDLIDKNKLRKEKISNLESRMELKDLALNKTEDRVKLWQETSYELEKRVMRLHEFQSYDDWLYFGLGFLAAGASVWAAGQLK